MIIPKKGWGLLIFFILISVQSCFIRPDSNSFKVLDLDFEKEKDFIYTKQAGIKYIQNFSYSPWGNYYILESDRITEWNAEGNFIREIGKIGQGPGEFSRILGINFNDDKIFVNDQGTKLIIYSKNGSFLKQIHLDFFLTNNFVPTNDNEIIGVILLNTESGRLGQVCRINAEGKISSFLDKPNLHGQWTVKYSKQGGVVGGAISPEATPSFILCQGSKGVWIAHNSRYVISFYDYKGNIIKQIKRQIKPSFISKEIRQYGDKKLNFKSKMPAPFFSQILSDEADRIFVIKSPQYRQKKHAIEADVFNERGDFLFSVRLPMKPKLILNGFIYFISEDPEGWQIIKKIKIRNYPEIFYKNIKD